MMSVWPNLPSWMNDAMKVALMDHRRDLTALLAVGKLIRNRPSQSLRRIARQAACRWLEEEEVCDRLLVSCPSYGDEAVEAAERVVQAISHSADQALGTIATLALLRDDICCLDACLATSFYHGPVKQGERLAELDSLVAGYQQAVDQVVEPYHHELRRLWIEFDEAAPAELLAMLSYGANPWWLDIVDPIWKGLKRHEDTAPMLLAAGALDGATDQSWQFERGIVATIRRTQDGSLWMILEGQALRKASTVQLVWMEQKKRTSISFDALRPGFFQGIVMPSIFESPVVYLLADGHIVVRDQ